MRYDLYAFAFYGEILAIILMFISAVLDDGKLHSALFIIAIVVFGIAWIIDFIDLMESLR